MQIYKGKIQMKDGDPKYDPFGVNDIFNQFKEAQSCPPGYYFSTVDNKCMPMMKGIVPQPQALWHQNQEFEDGLANSNPTKNPNSADRGDTPEVAVDSKKVFNPYLAIRGATAGLTWLSGKAERNRQNDYMYNQYSTLGQSNPMPVENFQPNPYNQYAMKGGSIVDILKKRHQNSSQEARAKLAAELGIEGYDFSAEKNLELINKLPDSPSSYKNYDNNISFNKAFNQARGSDIKEFTWNGKRYNTELATSKPQQQSQPKQVVQQPQTQSQQSSTEQVPQAQVQRGYPLGTPKVLKKQEESSEPNRFGFYNIGQPKVSKKPQTMDMSWVKPNTTGTPKAAPVKQKEKSPFQKDLIKIEDFFQQGINYAGRTYDKYLGSDKKAVSKLPLEKNPNVITLQDLSKENTKPTPMEPPIITGDTLWDGKREYHIPEVIDLTRIKMGVRNRGDLTPQTTDGLIFTAFDKQRIVNNKNIEDDRTYVGVDDEGNIRAGQGNSFRDKNYKLLPFNSRSITGFAKNSDGTYKKQSAAGAAAKHSVPLFNTPDGKTTNSNFLLKDFNYSAPETYGSITGGKALFTSPDYKHQVVLSGSVKNIEDQLEVFKKKNNLSQVNYMMLDNGSYARGYRTKDGKMSAEDWKKADNRNSDGNSGFFLKGRGFQKGGKLKKYQNGGNFNEEWLNSPMAKTMNKGEEDFTQQRLESLSTLSEPQMVDGSQIKKFSKSKYGNIGMYNPDNHSIIINNKIKDPAFLNKIKVHEQSHGSDRGGLLMSQEDKMLTDSEGRAMLNQARYEYKENNTFDPMTQLFKKEYLRGKNKGIQGLKRKYSDEQILQLMNSVSSNNPGTLPIAQKGGKPPIYVNDKNDPRIKAYNDSLTLHTIHDKYYGKPPSVKYTEADRDKLQTTGIRLANYNEKLGIRGLYGATLESINDEKFYRDVDGPMIEGKWCASILGQYKKPVQQYIYKVDPTIKPYNRKNLPLQGLEAGTPELLQRQEGSVELGAIPKLPYQVDYYNNNELQNKGFSTQEEADQFMNELNPITGLPEYKNRGDYRATLRSNKMQKGGLTPNKAREILHDGTIHGEPLTDKQRRFFGAKSKGNTKKYRGK